MAAPKSTLDASRRVEAAAHPQLNRSLTTLGNIALTLSDITPSASLLVVGPVVIATAGTGALAAYIVGCFIALNVALCMGELGSMFPGAGGLYSIVTRVLGRPIGLLALFDYIGQAIFLPASMAIGIGTYVTSLDPHISTSWVAAGTMIAVTLLGLFGIHFNAIMTGVFLALELSVVAILFLAGLIHPHQSLAILTHPVIPQGGVLTPVAAGAIMAALATALFSVNGYDSALNFSEETEGAASHIGKAVVVAATIGVDLRARAVRRRARRCTRSPRHSGLADAADRCDPGRVRLRRPAGRYGWCDHRDFQRVAGDHAPVRPHCLVERS